MNRIARRTPFISPFHSSFFSRWMGILVAVFLALGLIACEPAASTLERGFVHPPDSAKPRVYWWWLFNRVDKAGITRDLEEFKAKGINGVNLICTGGYAGKEPLPGVAFLGPEWRELFRHAVREAARLKIEIGFNLAGGWVMIGPWVTPDKAMKKVVQSELKVRGPGKFRGALPPPAVVDGYYKDVWVQAFQEGRDKTIDPRTIVDVSDRLKADGRFDWDVPAGDWTILRTGYTLTGSRWDPYPKGDTFAEGAGYQIDYLDPAALDDHFDHLGKLVLDEAAKAGGRLDYLWSDSWECGKLTWTRDFPAQFLRFRGYDLKPYLPALSGHTVVNAEVTARFKEDFDRTVEDGLAENFYGHFAELCRQRGIRMGSEAAGPGDLPPMDSLKNLGRCDLPAGEFWVNGHFNFPGGYNANPSMRLNLKQTASAAHIYGRPQAMAESFTQQERDRTHWSLSPADLKPYVDTAFGEGINAIMLHQATCQPPSDGKPGYEFCAGQHWNANSTWWEQSPAFFTYLSRCQYMLQQGVFAADVCYELGDRPPVIAPPKAEDPALGPGYDFDYANTEVLLNRMSTAGGRIVLPDGLSYRLLVLQNCTSPSAETSKMIGDALSLSVSPVPSRAMTVEAVRKIRDLVRGGATVVGPKPLKASGLKDYPRCDDEVRSIADEIWGDCDGQTRTEHRFGQGRVIWGRTPGEILAGDGVPPDFAAVLASGKPAGLDFIHRTAAGTDIYFVSNRNGRPVACECAFRIAGRQPEIWDPVSGDVRDAAAFCRDGGRTVVPLEFAPMQSLFVVFRKPIDAGATGTAPRNFPRLVTAQEIAGGWKVGFDPRWGGPAAAEFPELVSWTRRPEDGIKFYSGKATYHKTFDWEPGAPDKRKTRLFLDLGAVRNVAEVRLNGISLGVLWTAPWRVEITGAVKPTGNILDIDIVNLWANRVIGDLNLPKEKRVTVTHDVFRFDMITKTTSLLDSGLLGPVTILREADENESSPARLLPGRPQNDGQPSTRGQMRGEVVSGLDFPGLDRHARAHAVGVRAVGEDSRFVSARVQEIERNRPIARLPVGHGAQVPLVPLAPGHDDGFARRAAQDPGFVPYGGYLLDELQPRLALVGLRIIGQHDQRSIVDDIHSQLVGPRPLGHGLNVLDLELAAGGVTECARREVHGTGQHAGEGNGHVVFRRDPLAPLVVFHTHDAFQGQQVGIGPAQAGLLGGAVEIDHQVVLGGLADPLGAEVDHFLVIPVHEIHLDAGDAPFFVEGQGFVEQAVQRAPFDPQEDLDVFAFGVGDDLGDVDFGDGLADVVRGGIGGARVPAAVHQHVFDVMGAGEVDIMLHRRRVHAGRERHVLGEAPRPPVPSGLARLDPGRIGDGAGRVQVQDEVIVFDEPARRRRGHEDAPGGRFRRRPDDRLFDGLVLGGRETAGHALFPRRNG